MAFTVGKIKKIIPISYYMQVAINENKGVDIFFLIFICLETGNCETSVIQLTSNSIINLDDSIEELAVKIGNPKNIITLLENNNSKWNLICYQYDNLWITFFNGIKKVNSINIFDTDFKIVIDNINITTSLSVKQIEDKLHSKAHFFKINEDGYEVFLIDLSDYRELQLFINERKELIGAIIRYQMM